MSIVFTCKILTQDRAWGLTGRAQDVRQKFCGRNKWNILKGARAFPLGVVLK